MKVSELIKELEQMPQHLEVYAEGEPADKVILEIQPMGGAIVRIFKTWNREIVNGWRESDGQTND